MIFLKDYKHNYHIIFTQYLMIIDIFQLTSQMRGYNNVETI